MRANYLAATLLASAAFGGVSQASVLIYQNGFEVDESPYGPSFADASPSPGFYILPPAAPVTGQFFNGTDVGVQVAGAGSPAPAEGNQYAFVGDRGFFNNIGTDQAIGLDTQLSYTFTVAVGTRDLEANFFGVPAVAFSPITIGIEDRTGLTALHTATVLRSALPVNGFIDLSVTLPGVTVASGDVLRLFVDKGGTADPENNINLIVVDNLRVTAQPIPEPAGLAVLGAAGLLGVRRRR
jgi:MYXO-CTERM domain-containing protein